MPQFTNERDKLICLATWGYIDDIDLPYYREHFEVAPVSATPDAYAAMLVGQLDGNSPLEQTMTSLESYGSLPIGRSLFIFGRGSFNEILHFWNLRREVRDIRNRPMLLGVAQESLKNPQTLQPLVRFLSNDNVYAQKPDLGIIATKPDEAERALTSLGFEKGTGNVVSRQIGGQRSERPLSFGFFGPVREGAFKRGALVHDQVTITDGKTSFRPVPPPNLPQTGNYVRVGIEGLPVPMPLTQPVAEEIYPNAFTSLEGLTLKTLAWIGQTFLQLSIPDPWKALEGWAAAQKEKVMLSPPGFYGQALLDRLGTLDALAALADEKALAVLEALAPTSRKKLAQRVVKEAAKENEIELNEQLLADLLSRESRFLELQARSAGEIAGLAEKSKKDILPAIGSLVAAGFLTRGAAVRCRRCNIGGTLRLDQLNEWVRCPACRYEYLLPVLEQGEQAERPLVYQLDGLMARAMDQDLLPALLTLRSCPPDLPSIRSAWLGLEFNGAAGPKEHDLLLSDGATVWVAECKKTASITDGQLKDLLDFAVRHDARPVLAALEGSFSKEYHERVTALGGKVLERSQLLNAE